MRFSIRCYLYFTHTVELPTRTMTSTRGYWKTPIEPLYCHQRYLTVICRRLTSISYRNKSVKHLPLSTTWRNQYRGHTHTINFSGPESIIWSEKQSFPTAGFIRYSQPHILLLVLHRLRNKRIDMRKLAQSLWLAVTQYRELDLTFALCPRVQQALRPARLKDSLRILRLSCLTNEAGEAFKFLVSAGCSCIESIGKKMLRTPPLR